MTGLNLFDDRASAAGNFPSALRGYDRNAVDEYVLSLEDRLGQARNYIHDLEAQNAELAEREPTLQIPPGEGDFQHLGNHATEILRVAQVQARELTDTAHDEAERIKAEARKASDELVFTGQREIEDTRATTLADLRELRNNLDQQATQHVELAHQEAKNIVAAGERQASATVADAEKQAATRLQQARLEAEQLTEGSRRAAAEAAAEAARKREEMLTALRTEHDQLSAESARLLGDAKQQHVQAGEVLAQQVAEANRVRSEAAREAEQVKIMAARQTEEQIANARRQAQTMTEHAERQFASRKEQLGRETELLHQRKQSILAQLSSLSTLASQTAQDFPDMNFHEVAEDGFAAVATDPGPGSSGAAGAPHGAQPAQASPQSQATPQDPAVEVTSPIAAIAADDGAPPAQSAEQSPPPASSAALAQDAEDSQQTQIRRPNPSDPARAGR